MTATESSVKSPEPKDYLEAGVRRLLQVEYSVQTVSSYNPYSFPEGGVSLRAGIVSELNASDEHCIEQALLESDIIYKSNADFEATAVKEGQRVKYYTIEMYHEPSTVYNDIEVAEEFGTSLPPNSIHGVVGLRTDIAGVIQRAGYTISDIDTETLAEIHQINIVSVEDIEVIAADLGVPVPRISPTPVEECDAVTEQKANLLRGAGITTVPRLRTATDDELLDIPYFGEHALRKIRNHFESDDE